MKIQNYIKRLLDGDMRTVKLTVYALSLAFAVSATFFSYTNGYITAYGDAESHLNIAKRVSTSPTPGLTQLGGVWLPLPHILMVPLVAFDPLFRTGLGGSVVSGAAYIISCLVLWEIVFLLTGNKAAAFFGFLVFSLNPNVLYMQSTPMTELLLICLYLLSTYYFLIFLKNNADTVALIRAAFFGLGASITRYDGWLLVLIEAAMLGLLYLIRHGHRRVWEGRIILYSSLAFFGIVLWFLWCWVILGDPMYFTNSVFSAKSQQSNWLARGELPTYHNLPLSLLYFISTTAANAGPILLGVAAVACIAYLKKLSLLRITSALVLLSPFLFNVITLYMGQSVIFLPGITPANFEYNLFNVRYGILLIPAIAIFLGYFWSHTRLAIPLLAIIVLLQYGPYLAGQQKPITLEDGTIGLSAGIQPDAGRWLATHYNGGYVLLDDFARTVSIIKSNLPMDKVIYIGSKPYWDESLKSPEKYATWIVMQKNDSIWSSINVKPEMQARLYAHFQKVYTSPDILIFRRIGKAV
jgi:hypothetical protein